MFDPRHVRFPFRPPNFLAGSLSALFAEPLEVEQIDNESPPLPRSLLLGIGASRDSLFGGAPLRMSRFFPRVSVVSDRGRYVLGVGGMRGISGCVSGTNRGVQDRKRGALAGSSSRSSSASRSALAFA